MTFPTIEEIIDSLPRVKKRHEPVARVPHHPEKISSLTIPFAKFVKRNDSMIAPLESSRYTEIVTPSGVGIGCFLSQVQDYLLAEHGGADPSTAAYIAWVPGLNLAIFIATNTGKYLTAVAITTTTVLDTIIQALQKKDKIQKSINHSTIMVRSRSSGRSPGGQPARPPFQTAR